MNKRGFTLIELLAVIVILAIIALIATPIILGVVENSKKGAAKSSALGYIDAVEKQTMINELDETKSSLTEGTYDLPMDNSYDISVNGEKPTSGWMQVSKSGVIDYSFVINDYTVSYDPVLKQAVVEKGQNLKSKPLDTCPDCVYSYDIYSVFYSMDKVTKYELDYNKILTEHPTFLGYNLKSDGTVEKAYACGVENGTVFCLEAAKDDYTNEINMLNNIYPSCNIAADSKNFHCNGVNVNIDVSTSNSARVNNSTTGCTAGKTSSYCYGS